MKRFILLIILYLIGISAPSQTFSAAYDQTENGANMNKGNGWSYWPDVAGGYVGIWQKDLFQSYLNMYKATKDMHYLEKFTIEATRVMERRDDYIGNESGQGVFYAPNYTATSFNLPFPIPGCGPVNDITNMLNEESAHITRSETWSVEQASDDNSINCVYFYQPSMFMEIIEQMAEFCYALYSDNDFDGVAGKTVPQEVQNITNEPYTPTYPDWSYPFSNACDCQLTTYGDFAKWLYFHLCQTDQYIYNLCWLGVHGNPGSMAIWSPKNGRCFNEHGYWTRPDFFSDGNGEFAQTNQQCFSAMTLLYMYLYETGPLSLDDLDPNSKLVICPNNCMLSLKGDFDFHGRVQEIAQLVQDQLQPNQGDLSYINISNSSTASAWAGDENNYIDNVCSGGVHDSPEDAVHAIAIMRFADLCYRYKITCLNDPSCQIFSLTDMQKLANEFARDMTIAPEYYLPPTSASSPTLTYPAVSRWAQFVCGTHDIPDVDQYNGSVGPIPGNYTFLTAYNPYIYAEILNDYAYTALYSPGQYIYPDEEPDVIPYGWLSLFENANIVDWNNKANDYISSYKNIFNPVAVYPDVNASPEIPANNEIGGFTPIQWSSAASGNYDGPNNTNNYQEFVASKLSSDQFYMSEIQTSPRAFYANAISGTANLQANIINLTSGDFGGTGNTDYVAATDGTNVDIEYRFGSGFKSVFGSITPFPNNVITGGWATMTSIKCPDGATGDALLAVDQGGDELIYEYSNGKVWQATSNLFNGSGVGITSGFFDGAGNGQEVATVDNSGNINIYKIFVASNLGGLFNFILVHSYATLNNNQQINGFTSGNFDGSGQDQMVTHSNYDGTFRVYKFVNGVIKQVALQAFPDGTEMPDWSGPNYFRPEQMWKNGVMAGFKNFPGSPGDALATLRNCDGRIMVFDMQGVCEGQSVAGDYFYNGSAINYPNPVPSPCTIVVQNINNQYSNFNNNYSLDYNASNTLTASNDIVSKGTSVQFTSGNEIVLNGSFDAVNGSDFDAKIDKTLACAPDPYFHRPHHPPIYVNNYGNRANISPRPASFDSLALLVKQSATQGQFAVSLKSIGANEINHTAEVSVWNLLGQQIMKSEMLVSPEQQVQFNLSSQPRGMYLIMVKTKDRVLHGKVILQ